MNAAATN